MEDTSPGSPEVVALAAEKVPEEIWSRERTLSWGADGLLGHNSLTSQLTQDRQNSSFHKTSVNPMDLHQEQLNCIIQSA